MKRQEDCRQFIVNEVAQRQVGAVGTKAWGMGEGRENNVVR